MRIVDIWYDEVHISVNPEVPGIASVVWDPASPIPRPRNVRQYAYQTEDFGPVRWCAHCGGQMTIVHDEKTDEAWAYCAFCDSYVKVDDFTNEAMETRTINHKKKNDELVSALLTLYWADKYRKTWRKMKYFFKDGPCVCQEIIDRMKDDLDKVHPAIKDWLTDNAGLIWKIYKYEKESNKVFNTNACCPFIEDANGDSNESNNKDHSIRDAEEAAYEPATHMHWGELKFWRLFTKAVAKDDKDELKQLINWNKRWKWFTPEKVEYAEEFLLDEPEHEEVPNQQLELVLRQ